MAQFIDVLHQQVGLPLRHEWAMPITGIVALAYFVALVSGLITLLPSLAKDLFSLRVGSNLKRMWLDVHNALGIFSLPFHLIMALTTIVFAFHDQFYALQNAGIYEGKLNEQWAQGRPPSPVVPENAVLLPPDALIRRVREQAPGFIPTMVEYRRGPGGTLSTRIQGNDPRYAMRGPTFGMASLNAYNGDFLETEYLPGHQQGWAQVITAFFTLHFGSYGGNPVRWGYFVLGLAGAFMFYSGNLIWLESHRRRVRGGGETPTQTRASLFLGSLSVGGALGCVSGISVTLAAARWLPGMTGNAASWHELLYYGTFLFCIGWALARRPARGASELLRFSALTTALIPISSALQPVDQSGGLPLLELVALFGAVMLFAAAILTGKRTQSGPRDSVWSAAGAGKN